MDYITYDEIKEAFQKLQSSIYYDNNNLILRARLARYCRDNSDIKKKLRELLNNINNNTITIEKASIKFNYFPKKISLEKSIEDFPSNFISNNFIDKNVTVERCAVFADMKIEYHIIAILWIMKYGFYLDQSLNEYCLGNRLILNEDKNEIAKGKSLFKPYIKQYKKWWSDAISKAQQLLEERSDVTIVNFDLKDYYHTVQFDFKTLNEFLLKKTGRDISKDKINILFKRIHEEYKKVVIESKLNIFSDLDSSDNKFTLPVGLFSSPVIGNWYLNEFDEIIEQELHPSFYARYVDDIIIILKNRLITDIKNDYTTVKRNFHSKFKSTDYNITNLEHEFKNPINVIICKYLSNILSPYIEKNSHKERHSSKEDINQVKINYKLTINGLEKLKLQKDKIFIYQFNHKMSPDIINKFVDDQKNRSSEFRFLSDEEDESYTDFNTKTFESNFDDIDGNKAKFKEIEENKFQLSVFLSKLIKKRIFKGKGYNDEEIIKIDKFFQGYHCIQHYNFWEKIFTLYLVSDNKQLFFEFKKRIEDIIIKIEISSDLHNDTIKDQIIATLKKHLKYSILMAVGLYPDKFNNVKQPIIRKSLFRKSLLLRKQYIFYPLYQLTKEHIVNPKVDFTSSDYKILTKFKTIKRFVPHDVKFYEVCYHHFNQKLRTEIYPEAKTINTDIFKEYHLSDSTFDYYKILQEAFELFVDINGKGFKRKNPIDFDAYRNKYFKYYYNTVEPTIDINEIHLESSKSHSTSNITNLLRIAIVNKYVNSKDYEKSLLNKRKLSMDEIETYFSILDNIEKTKECDLFIQPELSLPHALIPEYLRNSAHKQKGFISGVEFIPIGKVGFNFVLTCLPININGIKDAIPVYRLKNHYSPDEEIFVRDRHMVTPKYYTEKKENNDIKLIKKYRYDLLVWKKVYLSVYYCFELADITHRSIMRSKIDAIFAPLWNKDTHYYNNIAESTVRDLHCYYIQANTSQYGESRVIRPTDHVRLDKARCKGGTTEGNPVFILMADLDISGLRDFQTFDYSGQQAKNRDKKSFKLTPPDFNKDNVHKRINNVHFGKEKDR